MRNNGLFITLNKIQLPIILICLTTFVAGGQSTLSKNEFGFRDIGNHLFQNIPPNYRNNYFTYQEPINCINTVVINEVLCKATPTIVAPKDVEVMIMANVNGGLADAYVFPLAVVLVVFSIEQIRKTNREQPKNRLKT